MFIRLTIILLAGLVALWFGCTWFLSVNQAKYISIVFLFGFIVLWLGLFFGLKNFIQATQLITHLLTRPVQQKKSALLQLIHTNNPYLIPVRHTLSTLLKSHSSYNKNKENKKKINYPTFFDCVHQLIKQAKWQYPHLQLKTKLDFNLSLPIYADYLFQALWELIKNAVESQNTQSAQVMIHTFQKDDWFCCEVSDSGPGMNDTIKKQAFEPYFTTKKSKIGMGLNLVEKTLARIGGVVNLHSSKYLTGLTVSLFIPLDYMEHIQNLQSKELVKNASIS